MLIAIIGTGNVGRALGSGWLTAGHSVIFGSREPHSGRIRTLLNELGEGATAVTPHEAAAAADVVVLATPFGAVDEVLAHLGDLSGKLLIDATNPIGPGLTLAVGDGSSGAQELAKALPNSHVVKAFNTTGAENMSNPDYDGQAATMFICGDDPAAKETVVGLCEDLGFDVADVGDLSTAGYLEAMALVWIRLAMVQGEGRDIAFRLMRR